MWVIETIGTRNDRDCFYRGRLMKGISLSFYWQPSLGFGVLYTLLALCWYCLINPFYFYLLLGILIISIYIYIINLIYVSRFISFVFSLPKCHYFSLTKLDIGKTFYESGIILYKFACHVFFLTSSLKSQNIKTLNIITFACFFFGIYIISTNFVVISHTINFSYKWLIPVFVYLCKILIKKLSDYVQVLISNKLSNLIVPYLSPKLLNFCYRLICKLDKYFEIIINYLSYHQPNFFLALKRYRLLYSSLSNKYPTLTSGLIEGYCALFLIVICSFNFYLDVAFSAFTISSLMIIYIIYIDSDFSRRHPVLYWTILVVSLLIFFCSILYLPYTVYARASREKAEKRPTGHKSKQKPGGPPHNNNTDPYMQQSTDDKKKSTSKKTTSKKAIDHEKKEKEKKDKDKARGARYREKLRNDTTMDENGQTRLDKRKAVERKSSSKYKKTEKGKLTRRIREILSKPTRYG